MEYKFIYRRREITSHDIEFIRKVIRENPNAGRCFLSKHICRVWNWTQPNGYLKDGVCRGLLLRLEAEGYIKLPPRKSIPPNPFVKREKPSKIQINQIPIHNQLSDIHPVYLKQIRRTPLEKLFNSLVEHYHYLGYSHPVGEHLKYIAFAQDRPIACLAWSSAAWHIGARDRFIGWRPEIREKNLHLIAYQSRFLILPWVFVSHLASHLLSLTSKIISKDWQNLYHHPIYWLETFVDSEKFKGTCYKAANWIYLGKTTGRGKLDQTNKENRSLKTVWGYPLAKDFRRLLCDEQCS
jgi:hypothetical protein